MSLYKSLKQTYKDNDKTYKDLTINKLLFI